MDLREGDLVRFQRKYVVYYRYHYHLLLVRAGTSVSSMAQLFDYLTWPALRSPIPCTQTSSSCSRGFCNTSNHVPTATRTTTSRLALNFGLSTIHAQQL